jgi:ATP-dependent RNA helicase RhlE
MTDEVDEVLDEYFNGPEEVTLAPSGTPIEKIQQLFYYVPNFLTKMNLLVELLRDESYSRVLLFVNNKKTADVLSQRLETEFPGSFGVIHSNKSQNYRLNTMASFQRGDIRGIVTTDIMARGLDITDITHVINIEFPEVPEKYVHRIGRTGRADKSGIAISFISEKEEEIKIEAELLMGKEIIEQDVPDTVELVLRLLDFEKERPKQKLISKHKLEGGAAFHEKSDKNKKVNLGGPTRRNPKKTKPTNRAVVKKRIAKWK